MNRAFLPALRGLAGSGDLPATLESKSVLVPAHGSITHLTGGGGLMVGGDLPGARAYGWDTARAVVEGYERVVWVYRCVELLSNDAARLPFRIGRGMETDTQEVLETHPLYRVLNKRANPLEKGWEFRKRLAAQLLLSKKGAFIEVTKSRAGFITRLDLLDPDRVNPVPSTDGEYIAHFEYHRRDGGLQELPTTKVRWVKQPHPTDPFSSTTPLEAAGLSVELDFLSRLYNVQFIKNDSRPGGVLGVDADGLADTELERIGRKFEPGVHAAGKITVLGTGPGGLSYVDTTTKPRDMAYGDAALNSKLETLAAFGIGESVLGNASGRSWDNAEQELYNYWTGPQQQILDLLAGIFDDDIDEEWDGFFDTSTVEALELPRKKAREEALKEFQQGLRSIDEYRPLAGLPTIDSAHSRALWVSPAKAPIPVNAEDAKVLGVDGSGAAGGAPAGPEGELPPEGGPGEDPNLDGQGPAAQAVAEAGGGEAPLEPAAAALEQAQAAGEQATLDVDTAGEAIAAVDQANETSAATLLEDATDAADAVEQARLEGKALPAGETGPVIAAEPGDDAYDRVQLAVSAVLQSAMARQQGIITARLAAPKTRQGTRFWTASGPTDMRVGDGLIDAEQVVQSDRLASEAMETASPVVSAAATDAGTVFLTALAATGLFGAPGYTAAELATVAGWSTAKVPGAVLSVVAEAIMDLLEGAREQITAVAVDADTIEDVQVAVVDYYADQAPQLAESIGEAVAFAVVNGAREAAAEAVLPNPEVGNDGLIVRTWVTRGDARVRPTHAETDGATLPVGESFDMGVGSVRYPRDPAGLPQLTYGCRCRLRYAVHYPSGAFLPSGPSGV